MTTKKKIAISILTILLALLYYGLYYVGEWELIVQFTIAVVIIVIVLALIVWACVTLLE